MMYDSFFRGTGQQDDISQARFMADVTQKKTMDLGSDIRSLRQVVDKLALINRALWEIIAESRGLTDEYLMNKVNEIDLRDGTLDGKMKPAIKKCPSCGRTLSQGRETCLYCGAKDTEADPFDRIDTDSSEDIRGMGFVE
ncbi:MAG: hypothetical protein U9N44_03500 [Chloroflexota bacterium]|nr:hypothetical protein [Chloroflexota bacterium]